MLGNKLDTLGEPAVIAIVGRPNVGKSTLFNRLAGRKLALVHDQPGMTRDRREATVDFMGLAFCIVDTPGLIDDDSYGLSRELAVGMRNQSLAALENSTVILFVIDGKEGCTAYDQELAQLIRCQGKPVVVIVNKCEGKDRGRQGIVDAARLGFGEPVTISAEQGLGISDIYDTIKTHGKQIVERQRTPEKPIKPLKLAILGRPNVGKSTLVNSLLGECRQLTANVPGVTRDSISLPWNYQGQEIELIDTAGIRRRGRIDQAVEKMAVNDAEKTLRFAEVVILVIDGSINYDELIEKQDLTLASQVIEEGRGLIIAVNKWDKVRSPQKVMQRLLEQLECNLAQARGITCISISALKSNNLDKLMGAVFKLRDDWNRRFNTAELNRWLQITIQNHQPPAISGRKVKVKYMTQIKTRPPTFVVFCTKADEVPEFYRRYLINKLRQDFSMPGVPLRINFKASSNPYV